jgi:hypothetical protein
MSGDPLTERILSGDSMLVSALLSGDLLCQGKYLYKMHFVRRQPLKRHSFRCGTAGRQLAGDAMSRGRLSEDETL